MKKSALILTIWINKIKILRSQYRKGDKAEFYAINVMEIDIINTNVSEEVLFQHLQFSSQIKSIWKQGDAIVEGIYNRKRRRRRLLHDKILRKVVRTIRRFARYEVLRSCLEGLLFDQVENVHENETFSLKKSDQLTLTQVYFATSAWDLYNYQTEIDFDIGEHITSTDYMKLIYYFNSIEKLLEKVDVYVQVHASKKLQDHTGEVLHNIRRTEKHTMAVLLNGPLYKAEEPTLYHDD